MPEHLRPAVLLGAFAGLRVGEVVGLRTTDVDFMRGVVTPAIQNVDEPLKTKASRTPIPIPTELALDLASVQFCGTERIVTDAIGGPSSTWAIQRANRAALNAVDPEAGERVLDLPDGFGFHDLRHYFASLLIAHGADVKIVQARLRHGSAKTTLDTYGHLWPDSDDSTRTAVASVLRRSA